MINVLHIVNWTSAGGISRVVLNYYNNMDHNKYHFDLCTVVERKGGLYDTFIENGFMIYYIYNKQGLNLFRHMNALARVLKENKYDVVHVHQAETSWVDLLVAKICGVKVRISHAHNARNYNGSVYYQLRSGIGKVMLKFFSTYRVGCGRAASICTFGKNVINEKGFVYLPNAIRIEDFRYNKKYEDEYKSLLKIPENSIVMGTVGRLDEEKNQIFIIDIMPLILKKNPNVYYVLVGDGSNKEIWRDRAVEIGVIDHVIFTGARDDVNRLLNVFSVFLLPSIYEGFPLAAVEAIANGLPCVISSTITDELKAVESVEYASIGDKESWINAILEAAKLGRNDNQITYLYRNNFDICGTVKILEKLYQSV